MQILSFQVKHYEDELNDSILSSEHLLYYLKHFPFLLPLIYNINIQLLKNGKKKLKSVNFAEDITLTSDNSLNTSRLSELNETESSQGTAGPSSICIEENVSLKKLIDDNDCMYIYC